MMDLKKHLSWITKGYFSVSWLSGSIMSFAICLCLYVSYFFTIEKMNSYTVCTTVRIVFLKNRFRYVLLFNARRSILVFFIIIATNIEANKAKYELEKNFTLILFQFIVVV